MYIGVMLVTCVDYLLQVVKTILRNQEWVVVASIFVGPS